MRLENHFPDGKEVMVFEADDRFGSLLFYVPPGGEDPTIVVPRDRKELMTPDIIYRDPSYYTQISARDVAKDVIEVMEVQHTYDKVNFTLHEVEEEGKPVVRIFIMVTFKDRDKAPEGCRLCDYIFEATKEHPSVN